MKRKLLIAGALLASGACALAQGWFALCDFDVSPTNGLAVDVPGNRYSGTFGMELWELNGTTIPPGVNLGNAPGSQVLGYNAMVAAGFSLEATYVAQTSTWGLFDLGAPIMPNVPWGSTVVIALAAWNSSAPSWTVMLANASQATRAGILAFDQRTTIPFSLDPPPNLAMSQDLVLSAVPEPSALALAGLGGALLLLLYRRGQAGSFRPLGVRG